MILTLCYMYATLVQWWRLAALRQRLGGTLNKHNALLLCSSTSCIGDLGGGKHAPSRDDEGERKWGARSLENLLYQHEGRIACTIVPRQKLYLGHWAAFPKDRRSFPLHYRSSPLTVSTRRKSTKVHLLMQASLEDNVPVKIDFLQMEKYGELIAWRAGEFFEVVLKSDLERISVLMNSFRFHSLGINHDLPLIKIETVDVEGIPGKIKYERRPSKFKFAHGPAQIREFAMCLRRLYSRINENINPKIMIENGKSLELHERKPISEVKPNKKPTKNTLDVHHSTTHKKKSKEERDRHSHRDKDKEREKSKEKHSEVKLKSPEEVKPKTETKVEKIESTQPESTPPEVKPIEAKESTIEAKKSKEKVEESVEENFKEKPKEKEESKDEILLKPHFNIDVSKQKKDEPKKKVTQATSEVPKDTLTVKKSYSDVAASPSSSKGGNLQRQNATSNSKETSPNRIAKPPNILVYADTSLARENVKLVLKTIVNKDRYTVYDFPPNAGADFWNASTTLVIVCGQVPPTLTPHLLGYLVDGGQLLCLCSDLLYSVLHPFSTAEVREHELVRFSYGEWQRVKMMHHIFCYQASPARKQFSREASDQSMNGGPTGSAGSSPVAPRTPSIVDIQHAGKRYTIQVQVLGAEETWQTPSLLLASVRHPQEGKTSGRAVFSQVHLEVDPMQYQDDETKYASLKESNQARLEILKHLLSTHLEIDCTSRNIQVSYTPGYFLGRHDLKMRLINEVPLQEGKLVMPEISLEFLTKNVDPPNADVGHLPVMVLRCPTNFNTVEYFETLGAERVGRLVIYADVLASTQRLLAGRMADGLAVIARRQTAGRGRSGNEWLSPDGCAMFSLQLHVPLESHLGRSLPLVQHLMMVAVAQGVRKASGMELEIGLKWPNDLYAYGNIKIGGLVAASTVDAATAIVTVGCGINLDNREPTICINDMIRDYTSNISTTFAATTTKTISSLSPEKFFASVFNEVEAIFDATQTHGIDHLLQLYYAHWLHTNAQITVTTADGGSRRVAIRGVDAYGFLQVQDVASGALSSVQADGNTFDMLAGLIAPKLT